MFELPNEILALILGNLEGIKDFRSSQRVSRSFHYLVVSQCWTKVRKIGIERVLDGEQEDQVQVTIATTLPGQLLRFPIGQSPLLLRKLVQNSSKVTSIYLKFDRNAIEERNRVLCFFLDVLAVSPLKIKEFHFENMTPDFLWMTAQSLTRFLNANAETLSSLKVVKFEYDGGPIPAPLLKAFRDCRCLETVEIMEAQPLKESILLGKTHLKSLVVKVAPPSTLLNSGASLRQLTCSAFFLADCICTVNNEKNLSLNHPLLSLEELQVQSMPIRTLPWCLFPNLAILTLEFLYIESTVDLVCDFFAFWKGFGGEKALECHVRKTLKGYGTPSGEDVGTTVAVVQRASKARATLTQEGAQQILFFRKKSLSFKISLTLKGA